MKKGYCLDVRNRVVTQFDCTCSPSGVNRYEFVVEGDSTEEIIKQAELLTNGEPVTLCEHIVLQ